MENKQHMEQPNRREINESLDLTSGNLERFVPELMRGLWELGSIPEYIIKLLGRNDLKECTSVLDLGCGKGAVLVKLARHFDIKAMGIDIVPEFIKEAKEYAHKYGVADKLTFRAADILDVIDVGVPQDMVTQAGLIEVLCTRH